MTNGFNKVCPHCFTEGFKTDNFCMHCGFEFSKISNYQNRETESYYGGYSGGHNANQNNQITTNYKEDKGYKGGDLYK